MPMITSYDCSIGQADNGGPAEEQVQGDVQDLDAFFDKSTIQPQFSSFRQSISIKSDPDSFEHGHTAEETSTLPNHRPTKCQPLKSESNNEFVTQGCTPKFIKPKMRMTEQSQQCSQREQACLAKASTIRPVSDPRASEACHPASSTDIGRRHHQHRHFHHHHHFLEPAILATAFQTKVRYLQHFITVNRIKPLKQKPSGSPMPNTTERTGLLPTFEFIAAMKVLVADLELGNPEMVCLQYGDGMIREARKSLWYGHIIPHVLLDFNKTCLVQDAAQVKLSRYRMERWNIIELQCLILAAQSKAHHRSGQSMHLFRQYSTVQSDDADLESDLPAKTEHRTP